MCSYSILDIELVKWEWLFYVYQIEVDLVEVGALVENIV